MTSLQRCAARPATLPRPHCLACRPQRSSRLLALLALGAAALGNQLMPSAVCRMAAAAEPRQLSFDPLTCTHFDLIRSRLALTAEELALYRSQGFVVLDQAATSNFGDAYFRIYGQDLPVLVTTDSLLHIMHRSFDNTLAEVEERTFAPALREILAACQEELGRRARQGVAAADNYRDVDLYLTVARNLLAARQREPATDRLELPPAMGTDAAALAILSDIESEKLQDPLAGEGTNLFGGRRPIDYSQFRPRGHYTKSVALSSYFRTMMWLGRADCGWFPLGTDPKTGIHSDPRRELHDAVLLTDLLSASGQLQRLAALDRAMQALLGQCDNLRPMDLRKVLDDNKISSLADLAGAGAESRLREALLRHPAINQRIQSQIVFGGKQPGEQIPPPALFQMFGQRFSIDSLALASVVYDRVQTLDSTGHYRKMPHGLDALAALGNVEARGLLADELQRWNYGPQLDATTKLTATHLASPAGQRSIYDHWLAAIRCLHADMSSQQNFPEALRTKAWRLKELNTQLASWAELRHDGILATKQSYTSHVECDYPAAFVEPYPEFYARLAALARRMAASLADAEADLQRPGDAGGSNKLRQATEPARKFWSAFAAVMDRLEHLARKELARQPFTADEELLLKQTIDVRTVDRADCGRGTGPFVRTYTGWYCDLLYPSAEGIDQFRPSVADVHTDSNTQEVLEAGVGRAKLALVAIDNGKNRMAFIGPVYTYYEFTRPATTRMTDEEFATELNTGHEPPRPDWVRAFEPTAR